jgi:YbbR domain-containing protein
MRRAGRDDDAETSVTRESAPFVPERGGRGVLGAIRGAFVDNAALKFVALVLALTVFILVHSDEEATTGATVDVSYTLPPGKVLVSRPAEQLRITVKGSRRRVRRFDPGELERVHVDLRGRGDGQLVFDRDMISGLPEGLELVSITPASMDIKLADRVERLVPVEIETTGDPAPGFLVTRREAVPAQVSAIGTTESLAALDAVRTLPIALDGRRRTVAEDIALEPVAGVEFATPRVRVEIDLTEAQEVRQLGKLPVAVRAGAGVGPADLARIAIEPREVEVVLRGATLDLQRVVPSTIEARVVPTAADLVGDGPHELEVRLVPALPGVGIELRPATVTVKKPP